MQTASGEEKIYDYLLESLPSHFDALRLLRESDRGRISLLRHRSTGEHFVLREYTGSARTYQLLRGVSCPHLPRVYEAAQKGEQALVLEEYIQGDDLAFLLQEGPLLPREARKIARDLCAALCVLHGLGAVHRDIKPENVLVRGDQAVLIDLDAARLVKQDQTADTQVLGTTGFAPPEQFGLSQTDRRADIYAMGVLLNVMLTGKHPSTQLARGRYRHVVRRCTMTNPENRYHSALHLMEALT